MIKILLTGISGYIGSHCALQALNAGYVVCGTVRSLSREAEVRAGLVAAGVDCSQLSFAVCDLMQDVGWDEAMCGCDVLMHVASPCFFKGPGSESELITPAVMGTKRVLHAAHRAGIKRVVLTSSIAAVGSHLSSGCCNPSHWTDCSAEGVSVYARSKTMAERAAWDFMREVGDGAGMQLTVFNPSAVKGPVITSDVGGLSAGTFLRLLNGRLPFLVDLDYLWTDVRDVAMLHVAAIDNPLSFNRRFIVSSVDRLRLTDLSHYLRSAGYHRVPRFTLPGWMLKCAALLDQDAKQAAAMMRSTLTSDVSATELVFSWSQRDWRETVLDMARSLSV